MIYVIQVRSGKEAETKEFMEALIDRALLSDVFYPTRLMNKRFHGQWTEVREKLIPGYLFVESEKPGELHKELKRIPRLTKMLGTERTSGKEEIVFKELSKEEVDWLEKMMGGKDNQYMDPKLRHEVGLTLVDVEETSEGRKITILEGPLKNVEGNIRKYDLHRRRAEVEVELMGLKTILYMGVVINGV